MIFVNPWLNWRITANILLISKIPEIFFIAPWNTKPPGFAA